MDFRELVACAERERADDPIVNDLIAALRDLAARYNRLWDEHESPLRKRLRERLIARRDALVAENAALVAERDTLRQVRVLLERWQSHGCPDCSGDCGSSNPPVSSCIMQDTRAVLALLPKE